MENDNMVSVIVPVYNSEKYIEKCITSILNQTYKDIELLLVDDGSTDNSAKICDEYEKKYPAIVRTFHKHNGGVSSARNYGIEKAKGKYIAFVDSDDYLAPENFSVLMNMICLNDLSVAFINRVDRVDESSNIIESGMIALSDGGKIFSPYEMEKRMLTNYEPYYIWAAIYDREMWREVCFPEDINYAEDCATNYRAMHRASKNIGICSTGTYYYRDNSQSLTHSVSFHNNYVNFQVYKERYCYACNNYPDIAESCLVEEIKSGVGIFKYSKKDLSLTEVEEYKEVLGYIKSNACRIFMSKNVPYKYKIAVALIMGGIYRIIYRITKVLR